MRQNPQIIAKIVGMNIVFADKQVNQNLYRSVYLITFYIGMAKYSLGYMAKI